MSCIHNNYCAFPEKITRIWCKAIGRKEINKSSETSSPLLISFNSFLESVRLFCLRERYAESETLKAISGHGCLVVMHHPSCRYEVERWYLLGNSICKGQKMITGPHSPLILHWTRQHALTCSPAMKTKRLTMNVPPFSCRRILLSFPFSDEEKEIATSITGTLSAFTWLTSFLLRISSFLSPADYLYHPQFQRIFQTMCALYIHSVNSQMRDHHVVCTNGSVFEPPAESIVRVQQRPAHLFKYEQYTIYLDGIWRVKPGEDFNKRWGIVCAIREGSVSLFFSFSFSFGRK